MASVDRRRRPGWVERVSADWEPRPRAGQVVSNVAGFGENLLNLAELQARMAAMELRQNVEAVKTGRCRAGSAGTVDRTRRVAGACWRGSPSFWSRSSGGAAVMRFFDRWVRRDRHRRVLRVAAAVVARRQRLGFPLSAEEFTRNLNWVHTVLRLSGRRPSRRS